MIAGKRGNCEACPNRIRPGESVVLVEGGWAHAKCPPARVRFECECGVPTPCGCGDNSLAELEANRAR